MLYSQFFHSRRWQLEDLSLETSTCVPWRDWSLKLGLQESQCPLSSLDRHPHARHILTKTHTHSGERDGARQTKKTETERDIDRDKKTENREKQRSQFSGHQVRDGVAIPQSKLSLIIVPVWKNYRDGNGKEPEKKKVQLQAQSEIQLKGSRQVLTLLLRLWSAHKKEPIMTALQKTQWAAERVKCRYLHPSNGQKLLNPVVELEESLKKLRRVTL
jgi:hypothetical protein